MSMMQGQEDPNGLRRYRLIAEIGHGGMADVFLAVAQGPVGFNKLVVIKKARKDLLGEADILAMFLDEARLAARLNHPNVVQTYEIGQEGDRYFIAMEYLDGQPLNRVLSRCGARIPTALKLRIFIEVLAGLHHAHQLRDFDGTPLGVVHRDATPQNVFITYDGGIKVVDFGIAKALDSSSHTRTGVVKGKVAYMSPEQVRGERLDARTDVFAVGVMLWEAIAGRRMWEELPEITIVHELMHNLVPSILTAMPGVPSELARICDRAIAPQREHRYLDALELARDLEDFLAASGERATARDVGSFLSESFAADREKVRGIIESQLRDVRWQQPQKSTGVALPSLEIVASGAYSKPSSFSSASHTERFDTGQARAAALAAQATSGPNLVTGTNATEPALPQGGAPLNVPTNSGAALPMPLPQPAPAARSPWVPIAIAAIVVGGAVAVGVTVAGGRAPSPAAAQAPTAAPAPPSTAAPDDQAVKVSLHVRPSDAKIYLDDVLLSAGSFDGKLVRSDNARNLRIEADGYLPRKETVTFGAALVMSVDLERDPNAAPTATAAAQASPKGGGGRRAAAPPKEPKDDAPSGRPKPKHDIDADSPYSKGQ
jgi:serine/threonine-protein kinase